MIEKTTQQPTGTLDVSASTRSASLRQRLRLFGQWANTGRGLAWLFAVGLIIRLLIAPHVGFYGDIRLFGGWARRLADGGTRSFYAPGYFADYPPGYLYVLLLVGKISKAVGSQTAGYMALKLPAILGDLGLAWVVGELAVRLKSDATPDTTPVRALAVSAVLFNPAVLALGAVWGQVDVVPALFVVTALGLLLTGRRSLLRDMGAMVVLALGLAMKPQAGLMLPAVGLAIAWRYLARRKTNRQRLSGLTKIAILGLVGFGTLALTGLPFGLGPRALLAFYKQAASQYPTTSVWAFNLWGFIGGFWRYDVAAQPGWVPARVLGIQALHFGTALFVIASALVVRRTYLAMHSAADRARALFFSAAATSLIGYAVLTRMHERYLFLSLACLSPFVTVKWMRRGLGVLSAIFVVNLYLPFVIYNQQWNNLGRLTWVRTLEVQPLYTWLFGGIDSLTAQKKILSFIALSSCLGVAGLGWRWLRLPRRRATPLYRVALTMGASIAERVREIAEGQPRNTYSGGGTLETPSSEPMASPSEPLQSNANVQLPQTLLRFVAALRDRSGSFVESRRRTKSLSVDETAAAAPNASTGSRLPRLVVGVAVLFNFIILRHEAAGADNLNDTSFHLQMVRWAVYQIRHGHIPLDGWYPNLTMGSAHFHHYQSLAHIVTAYIGLLFGANRTALWSMYVLLATWPIAVFWAARLFGWDRWSSVGAAVVSSFVVSKTGYGYEQSSYTWQGWGVWSQLWAMWLLPLSWATSWRAVTRKGPMWVAAVVLTFTMAFHFITGYLALLPLALWVLVGSGDRLRRLGRAALVGAGSLVAGAWFLVPLVADRNWATKSIYYLHSVFSDSFGAKKIMGWVFTGQLFDSGRFPVLTLLLAAGTIVCIRRWRSDERVRVLLGVTVLSLLLFFGRATFGRLADLLPGHDDLQMHRFMMGVQLGGIFIAGVGGAALYRAVRRALRRFVPARPFATAVATAALALLVLAPAWVGLAKYNARGAAYLAAQRTADATDGADAAILINEAKRLGHGRIYGGLRSNWGQNYKVGQVPMYAVLTNRDADGVGFTFRTIASLSNDVEAIFDDSNPTNYDLLNVRYLMYPRGSKPPVAAARFLDARGRYSLWQVPTSGYLDVVDTTTPINADRTNLASQMTPFMRSRQTGPPRLYPTVAFAGRPAATPTAQPGQPRSGPAGRVVSVTEALMDGVISGEVVANRPAVVLFKSSFDPHWRVTVDGTDQEPQLIAPSFVGVNVSSGTHTVQFKYTRFQHYGSLLLIGLLTIAGLFYLERRRTTAPATVRVRNAGAAALTASRQRVQRVLTSTRQRLTSLRSPGGLRALGRDLLESPGLLLFVCVAIVLTVVLWHQIFLHVRDFDNDELEHVHAAWSIAHGLLPYRDFWENHAPLLWFFLSPGFRLFHADTVPGDATSVLILFRQLMWLVMGATLLVTYRLGKRWRGKNPAAIGIALLATSYVFHQKTMEIRPDTIASLLLVGSVMLAAGAVESWGKTTAARRTILVSGVLIAAAVMFTEKAAFAIPGMLAALLWHEGFKWPTRDRWAIALRFVAGGLLVPLAVGGYFVLKGGFGALFQDLVVQLLGWKGHAPLSFFVWTFLQEGPALAVLTGVGLARELWWVGRGRTKKPLDVLMVFAAASLIGGLILNPSRYFQYFLLFLPFICLFGGSLVADTAERIFRASAGDRHIRGGPAIVIALSAVITWLAVARFHTGWQKPPVEFIALLGSAAVVVVLAARLRAGRGLALAAAAALVTLVPLYRVVTWEHYATNYNRLAQISYVIQNSKPNDRVLDGISGAGSFRPQAFWIGFLYRDMRWSLPVQNQYDLRNGIRTGLIRPHFVVLDDHLIEYLGPQTVDLIRSRYVRTSVDPIWVLPGR